MRMAFSFVVLAAAALLAGTASAQDSAGGEYAVALERLITETAAGVCPAELMAAELLAKCEEQVGQIGPALASLGPITDVILVRAEGEGAERVEVYEVTHQTGQTVTWGIGGLVDGKFTRAFAGG